VDLREVDLRGVDLRGAINTEHAFVDQAQRAILGLTDDDTVTQLQQQLLSQIHLSQIHLV
jgi:hypothetical protein